MKFDVNNFFEIKNPPPSTILNFGYLRYNISKFSKYKFMTILDRKKVGRKKHYRVKFFSLKNDVIWWTSHQPEEVPKVCEMWMPHKILELLVEKEVIASKNRNDVVKTMLQEKV